jgi:hypothetical protein
VADKDHFRRLHEGVERWNDWRRQNPEIIPDLSSADLRRVDLRKAVLSRTNFDMADLSHAHLNQADLSAARLRGADLHFADFRVGNLRDADITDAGLIGTDFRGADLTGSDLTRTTLYEVLLVNCSLRAARGLDTCIHAGPSVVDYRTLYRSGVLPESFLRGCGFPAKLVPQLAAIVGQQASSYSCFISYSSKDEQFVQRLRSDLQTLGIRCWFAPEDLETGARTRIAIELKIREHDKLLLVLSEHSISSAWVTREVKSAVAEEHRRSTSVLFPIRLDDAITDSTEQWAHDVWRNRNVGDFRHWRDEAAYRRALGRLVRDLTKPAVPDE